ncbi:hypothetical protein [Stieleria tagensis]|nr:hypothetical protein [Stieleria tagensis]
MPRIVRQAAPPERKLTKTKASSEQLDKHGVSGECYIEFQFAVF